MRRWTRSATPYLTSCQLILEQLIHTASLLSLLATDALHHDALFFIVNLANEVAALKNFHSFVHYLSDLFLVET
jgi:hypothetical protein